MSAVKELKQNDAVLYRLRRPAIIIVFALFKKSERLAYQGSVENSLEALL